MSAAAEVVVAADELVRAIAAMPPAEQRAAGIGWRLGLVDGQARVLRALGQAGDDVRAGGVPALRWPSWDELQARGTEHPTPCRVLSCRGSCSRCIYVAALARRGGRPYAGVEVEARLDREAS